MKSPSYLEIRTGIIFAPFVGALIAVVFAILLPNFFGELIGDFCTGAAVVSHDIPLSVSFVFAFAGCTFGFILGFRMRQARQFQLLAASNPIASARILEFPMLPFSH